MKDMLLSLADELEGMDVREGCRTCPADGTKDCRGDLSCEEAVARAVARRVREIVEHDECEVTTMSAYDLLPEDEREAIALVREQGGLDAVKASVHQGAMEHGYLLKIAEMLGTSIYDGSDNADALLEKLSERLMPEGMEWPRFEDGEPVRLGEHWEEDGFDESVTRIDSIEFADDGVRFENEYNEVFCRYGERVKRPAPKVLDADGAEIRVGDTVYVLGFDEPLTVKGFTDDGRVLMSFHDENSLGYKPSRITHEQPDTWERIEEDATLSPWAYADRRGIEVPDYRNEPDIADVVEPVLADVVRRCRALAERGA